MSECYGEWSDNDEDTEQNLLYEDSKQKLQEILNDLLKKYPEKKDDIKMILGEIINYQKNNVLV